MVKLHRSVIIGLQSVHPNQFCCVMKILCFSLGLSGGGGGRFVVLMRQKQREDDYGACLPVIS